MTILRFPFRIYIWLKRFRHRKGYGVHSPFAFNLITWVINENYPYYQYAELSQIRKRIKTEEKIKGLNSPKIDELLFRLTNRMQPETIIEIGTSSGLTTLYLTGGKQNARCDTFDSQSPDNRIAEKLFVSREKIRFHKGDVFSRLKETLNSVQAVDFVYLNVIDEAERIFESCMEKTGNDSLIIIKGIHNSIHEKKWWSSIVADERTGITFDLYDIGLVFFDKRKIKQHYIVNF